MGTWGTGNFENDDAGEYLDAIFHQLSTTIETSFSSPPPEGLDFGYVINATVMPSIDILILLSTHYSAWFEMDEDTAQRWREVVLKGYDETIGVYEAGSSYAEERRVVIESTFDRLMQVVRSWNS